MRLSTIFILTILTAPLYAQLRVVPIDHPGSKSVSTARTQALEPISLPFWDDFSYQPDTLWSASATVYINEGIGINAPSRYVATFDGLNADGVPYNPNDLLLNGFTDSLISRPIRLDEVTPDQLDSVFISFYYQWKGNREAPDPTDFLQLEFLNDEGVWEIAATIESDASLDPQVFYDTLIQIKDDRFFHDAFQFRFRSFGRLSGPYDSWNIDYVYLNTHRYDEDTSYPDRAIASQLGKLFSPYTTVPIDHFTADIPVSAPAFEVYNLRDEVATTLSFLATGYFTNYKDGIKSEMEIVLGDTTPINITNGVIFALERRTVTLQVLPDPGDPVQFNPDADSIQVKIVARLFSGDVEDINDGTPAPDYAPHFAPIDFRVNDTTSTTLLIKHHYAYDDGTAEYAAGLTQPGNLAAYRYDLLPDGDTLTGLQIHYPYIGGPSSNTMDFFVYADDDGIPGTLIGQELIPVRREGINSFVHITLQQGVVVPKSFYIGWQQPLNGNVFIGLDKSHHTADRIYVNTNGTWVQNTDVKGSLMFRPVFGKAGLITGIEKPDLTKLYPNPAKDFFYLEGEFAQLQIADLYGRMLEYSVYQEDDRTKVVISNAPSGIYIVKYRVGPSWVLQKIVIRH